MVVKDPGVSAKKWSTRASGASGDYASGVANTTKEQAVQAAAAQGRFAKGLQRAGTPAWKAGVATKGAQRYSQGVGVAAPNYQAGVAPYFTALGSLSLQPRGVKGTNMGRVQAVVDALMKTKAAQ
jgi:hypothetical protein